MTAELYQFVPRSNPKADRAFCKGDASPLAERVSQELDQGMPSDSPPFLAPDDDPA